jgi:hypothetical protein
VTSPAKIARSDSDATAAQRSTPWRSGRAPTDASDARETLARMELGGGTTEIQELTIAKHLIGQ